MNVIMEIKKLRRQIASLKEALKFMGFRMGVLITNTYLLERQILTVEERNWLITRYKDDITAIHITLNQVRDRLEFNLVTYKLLKRRRRET